ncbi:hypothetical protein M407DRAFT_92454 [Tulasnella calospora MUT 4182]|uniref:Uncharacterized protein n=1 Tax=Tulasnella calospora MUT 4182 TaxID=1051891 RepID=A0A0C3Q779_9AGAM|nr:hypothetical protein M407DRAFT_92454 [Tulasnella calospora MUT 4182]
MAAEVDEEREGCDTLKAQLLTLAAAMNGGLQTARGEATHESRTRIRGIRKALGQKWESQLATVLQDIDYLGENGGTTTSLINTEEVQASQHPTGSQLQAVRSTSPTVIEDPDVRMEE